MALIVADRVWETTTAAAAVLTVGRTAKAGFGLAFGALTSD
jgi:hypothetical protein